MHLTAAHIRQPVLVLALIGAAVALLMAVSPPSAHSASYRSCTLSERDGQPSSGKPTYNFTLKRQRTTCGTARKVMRAYHSCRSKRSVRCSRRILRHWRCSAHRQASIPTQFNATYVCKWGTRRVRGTYQQSM